MHRGKTPLAALWPAFGPATWVSATVAVAFVIWQATASPAAGAREVVSDLLPIPLALTATVLAVLAARHAVDDRPTYRAWLVIAVGFAFYGLGDALWAYCELVRDSSPFPSVADAGYLAFYPMVLLGLLSFRGPSRTRAANLRLGLDVAIVVLAGAMVAWYLVIGDVVTGDASTSWLLIAYPVGDLVLIFGLATTLMRGLGSSSAPALRLLMVGLGAFVVADLGFGHLEVSGSYTAGSWPDSFWLVALVFMVAAAERQLRAGHDRRRRASVLALTQPGEAGQPISLLPYVAVIVGYGLLIAVARQRVQYPVDSLLIGAVALTGVVVVRQLAALRDNMALAEQFRRLATTDALTGLINRRHLLDLTEHALAMTRLDDRPLAVLMIDVDHFKTINDTYGHAIGDETLRWLAQRCPAMLRPSDVVSRFGGDELVVLMPDTTLADAIAAAERLRADVADHRTPIVGGPAAISLSIGVAGADGCADVESLLRGADAALYAAKRAGRGCTRVHPGWPLAELGTEPGGVAADLSRPRGLTPASEQSLT